MSMDEALELQLSLPDKMLKIVASGEKKDTLSANATKENSKPFYSVRSSGGRIVLDISRISRKSGERLGY
jgi:hypothetical protein